MGIVSTDQLNLYRANGVDRTKNNPNANLSGQRVIKLKINGGQCNEPSDWAIGHIFIFDKVLEIEEIEDIEQHLMAMYNVYNPCIAETKYDDDDDDEFDDINLKNVQYEKLDDITDKIIP